MTCKISGRHDISAAAGVTAALTAQRGAAVGASGAGSRELLAAQDSVIAADPEGALDMELFRFER